MRADMPRQGDPKLVAHPAFRDIPQCLFALNSVEAKYEYDIIAGLLFNAGRLTVSTHRVLSSYAMQFDTITQARAEGKLVPASRANQLDRAWNRLGFDKLDKPIAAPTSTPVNKYARTGFAHRLRQAVGAHHNR